MLQLLNKINAMIKSLYILVLLITLTAGISTISAQTYYKTNTSNFILTESGYEKLKKGIREQHSKKGGEITISEILLDSTTSNDSVIKTVQLDIKRKGTKNAGKRPTEKVYSYLNKKFPAKTLYDLNDNEIKLENLKGKPVVINFWFTRCKPCVEEIPILNKLVEKYSDKIHFISITPDNKETILPFLKDHDFNYKHLVNAKNFMHEIGLNAYPKNVFIDKNGIVKRIKNGIPYIQINEKREIGSEAKFESYIKELL